MNSLTCGARRFYLRFDTNIQNGVLTSQAILNQVDHFTKGGGTPITIQD